MRSALAPAGCAATSLSSAAQLGGSPDRDAESGHSCKLGEGPAVWQLHPISITLTLFIF